MPLTLATRIGADTLGKLEDACTRRYAEAVRLLDTEPLGSIYLFGYTIEIRLKAAYYRTVGLVPTSSLAPVRLQAEVQIRQLLGIRGPVGHSLMGWARLLEHARSARHGAAPLPAALLTGMYGAVHDAGACWTEVLRYRANRPYDVEVAAMRTAAKWFKVHGRGLWR